MEIDITKNKKVHEIEAYAESESHPGMYYKVTFNGDIGWKCTCPQNQKKGANCKHIEQVSLRS